MNAYKKPIHSPKPSHMEKIAVRLIMASSALVLCFSVYKLFIDLA